MNKNPIKREAGTFDKNYRSCSTTQKKTVFFVGLICLFLFIGVSHQYAQLCEDASFYDARSWTWSYAGPCTTTYNCLSYAIGITNEWVWPWSGYPTTSQVDSFLSSKGYYSSSYSAKVISYGYSSSAIEHFSRVTGTNTCRAKLGRANLLNHGSWDPYYSNYLGYGPKQKVYYVPRYVRANITGPTSTVYMGIYIWYSNPQYGYPPYSYKWYIDSPTILGPQIVGTNASYDLFGRFDDDVYLNVEVTDSFGNKAYDSYFVSGTYNGLAGASIGIGINDGSSLEWNERNSQESPSLKQRIGDNLTALLDEAAMLDIQSGNPYKYIDSPYFREIVEMGPAALMTIRGMIMTSSENGLKEYILAIASEKIAGVNLKKDSFAWITGKQFRLEWDKHLEALPQNAATILDSNRSTEEKNKALVELGTPVIPYLIDQVASGKSEFKHALKTLLKRDTPLLEKSPDESIEFLVEKNADKIRILRNIYDAYRK